MMQFNGLVYNFSLAEADLPSIRTTERTWRPHDFVHVMHPNDVYGREIIAACIRMHDAGHTVAIVVQESKNMASRFLVRIALPRDTMERWDEVQDGETAAPSPIRADGPDEEFVPPMRRMNFNRRPS
jgi:hypothetical protein